MTRKKPLRGIKDIKVEKEVYDRLTKHINNYSDRMSDIIKNLIDEHEARGCNHRGAIWYGTDEADSIQNHISSFALRLGSYAASLQKRERLILAALLVGFMDPLDGLRFQDPSSILKPDEALANQRTWNTA